jgi:hypothetical protein
MTALSLTRTQSAALCGLTPSGFDGWVRRGIVPPPIMGTRRWSRVQLERALAGQSWVPPDQAEEEDPMERWERENPYEAQKRARQKK